MAGDGRGLTAAQNPTHFLPLAAGKRACAGVAQGVTGSGAPSHREGPITGAVAVAGRDAAVPSFGRRLVGGPDRPADQADSARVALFLPRAPRRAARVYQENARDTG